jgi:hypothetical protein
MVVELGDMSAVFRLKGWLALKDNLYLRDSKRIGIIGFGMIEY